MLPSSPAATPSRQLHDAVEAELVGLLFSALLPMSVMGILTGAVGIVVMRHAGDPMLGALSVAAAALTLARVAITLSFRPVLASQAPGRETVVRIERIYGAGSIGFSIVVGLLGARCFMLADPIAHLLVTGLVFGYGCGVVSRLAIRPWICVPSLALGVVPAAVAALARGEAVFVAHGLLILGFAAASLETVRHLYRTTRDEMLARRELAGLARHDSLTGLPNRLALRERLGAMLKTAEPGRGLALLFVDLDRFKEVNDRLGHPLGDTLLREVSQRLTELIRPSDIVARIGGDEFIIVQSGVRHSDEAEILARRVVRCLRTPFKIDGREIRIGGSVGLALSSSSAEAGDDLIARADEALYSVKQRGRNGFATASVENWQGFDAVAS